GGWPAGRRHRPGGRGGRQTPPAGRDPGGLAPAHQGRRAAAAQGPVLSHPLSHAQLAGRSGEGVGVGRPARGRGGQQRRPNHGRLPHDQRGPREAATIVRPRPDGPGEPDRRRPRRQSAAHPGARRPLADARDATRTGGPRDTARAVVTRAAPPLDAARILVVDDELGPRESLRMLLKPSYQIQTADSGRAALDQIPAYHPDIVILDIKMPELDGLEVLKRIKRIDPAIEVVMITAYASLETVKRAL